MRSTTKNRNDSSITNIPDTILHTEIYDQLIRYRKQRQFNPAVYTQAKIGLLCDYFIQSDIKSCVIGVSGGVDSAVALALLHTLFTTQQSPLVRILPALLPKYGEGASNQDTALSRGHAVIRKFGLKSAQIDLSLAHATLQASVDNALGIKSTSWSAGQLVSNLRTPALYHIATLLTQENERSVVCGTTNRDEGSYTGFFGKAADGMVDIQPISDLHKSEVYQLAHYLGVPQSIIDAEPTGDTFDGQTDVEMLGVCYNFIEFYTYYLHLSDEDKTDLRTSFGEEAKIQFDTMAAQVEKRHRINAHKYISGSQSIHFDVYERCTPGGWRPQQDDKKNTVLMTENLVAYFNLDPGIVSSLSHTANITRKEIADYSDSAFTLEHVFSNNEADLLAQEASRQHCIPAARDGYARHYDVASDEPGSWRCTAYDEKLAEVIWQRIRCHVSPIRILDEYSSADWQGHPVWRATGINPVMRFIKYTSGGNLIPHFDAGHDFRNDKCHTLMSVIIYLTDGSAEHGGITRLLHDAQRNLPVRERDFSDLTEQAPESLVLAQIMPCKGTALIMDHRIPHEATPWSGTHDRILLRTDIIFERCGIPYHPRPIQNINPLLQILGLNKALPRKMIDSAYQQQLGKIQNHEDLKHAWKIMRDPFYGSAYAILRSTNDLVKAGYLDDQANLDTRELARFDSNWLMTPAHKIIERLKRQTDYSRRLVVLVSTGAFSPVHKAHIEMMECAKQELESRGDIVLGGYLSPSHQTYIDAKCGADTLSATHRIALCEKAVSANEWLMIDPWEALQNDRPVNFTDVIEHLSAYLARHIKTHRSIQVVYVFGSDNASFALAFIQRGYCVCVPRGGHELQHAEMTRHPLIRFNRRVLMLALSKTIPALASSQIRLGDESALPEIIQAEYKQIHSACNNRPLKLYLRDEKNWALEPWEHYCKADQLSAATRLFMSRLIAIFNTSFQKANQRLEIEILDLSKQRSEVAKAHPNEKIISLDSCIEGTVNLGVSRCFHIASPDNPTEFVARPGYKSLTEQFAAIPPDEYILLDDDIATGATIEFVKKSLPSMCAIKRTVSLCNLQTVSADDTIIELCDFRDFLVGARNAGLVVKLYDGSIARAPYILPYVRPYTRVRLPVTQEMEFSYLIWQLNRDFFRSLSTTLQVQHADKAFQTLAAYIGFGRYATMEEVCQWHMDKLLQADDTEFLMTSSPLT